MNQTNRRHNSVLNPTGPMQIQLFSPQISHSTSNNSSTLQNCNIAPPKIPQYLQQHSLFPPIENNSCICDNSDESDNNTIIKQMIDLVDNNTVDSLSKSSDSDENEEDDDDYKEGSKNYPTQYNMNKRYSDGMMLRHLQQFHISIANKQADTYYNPNFTNNNANINNNPYINKGNNSNQYMNYSNVNTISPMKIDQWRQSQNQSQSQSQSKFNTNNNSMNNLRRYSQFNIIPFALQNNTMNIQSRIPLNNNLRNPYMNNNPSFCPQSPISMQNNQNNYQQNYQKQILDDQIFFQNLLSLLKDQNGSRLVQEKLEAKKDDQGFLRQFYGVINTSLLKVVNDSFGNYAMQRFIEILIDQHQSQFIAEFFVKIKNDLFNISLDNFGSRFFQKFLNKLINCNYKHIETTELNEIFKQLIQKHLFGLCYDKNGNHVFQKILTIYPKDKNDFIFEELNKYAIDISKLQQNVVILQTVFKLANQKQERELVNTILSVIDQLINDEYGNFLVSYIVEHLVKDDYNEMVYNFITGNMMMLSQKKYSSNVIDKFIETPNNPYNLKLVNYINNNKLAKDMITNEYGNYVIQKALKISDGKLFMSLIQQIEPMLETLIQLNIGRKIYNSLIQNYGDCFQNSQQLIANNQIQISSKTNNNNSNSSKNIKNKMTKKDKK